MNFSEKNKKKINLEKAWNRISQKTGINIPLEENKQSEHSNIYRNFRDIRTEKISKYLKLSYATIILLLFIFSFLYIQFYNKPATYQKKEKISLKTIVVELGHKKLITLPDKSTIELDAGSEISFPKPFNDSIREVFLTGEGYFEVTHNPKKSFIVHTDNTTIKVLGTKFNISAWPKFKTTKVTVVEGKVLFGNNLAPVVLTKGETSRSLKDGRISKPVKTDVKKQLGWLQHELILRNTPLNQVVDKLSRWYNLKIKLPAPIYNHARITGTFSKKNPDEILSSIALMINLKIKRSKNIIELY